MNKSLLPITRLSTLIAALSLIAVIFLPIWRIELDAPQYPEGLMLLIYADKLAGDVDVINGLNHYIGMRTLHTDDFVEFSVLPYIFAALSLFGILSAIINRKWFFFTWVIFFILFGIVSMVDFYRWNYNYGHNLDPTAPIQVPGMSYQPPIIGFKQLLNFGAYSIPDAGGWIIIIVGVILLIFGFIEIKAIRKNSLSRKTNLTAGIIALAMITLSSCNSGPRPIRIGQDACAFCKMTISDKRFGAELVTDKGKIFVFDDVHCITAYAKQNSSVELGTVYLTNFENGELLKSDNAVLWRSEKLRSPMGSNIAAFPSASSLEKYKNDFPGADVQWNSLLNEP